MLNPNHFIYIALKFFNTFKTPFHHNLQKKKEKLLKAEKKHLQKLKVQTSTKSSKPCLPDSRGLA